MAFSFTCSGRSLNQVVKPDHETSIVGLLLTAFIVYFSISTVADESNSQSLQSEARQLDGLMFSARIVREGGEEGKQIADELTFKDGIFSSKICKKYNFADAPYWIRLDDGQLHFLAELNSPTDGTMIWKGAINGDTLEGTMRWTKKRWYWTIDTEHKIRGALEKVESRSTASGQ